MARIMVRKLNSVQTIYNQSLAGLHSAVPGPVAPPLRKPSLYEHNMHESFLDTKFFRLDFRCHQYENIFKIFSKYFMAILDHKMSIFWSPKRQFFSPTKL